MKTKGIKEKDLPRSDVDFYPTMELRYLEYEEQIILHPICYPNKYTATKTKLQQKFVGVEFGTVQWRDIKIEKAP